MTQDALVYPSQGHGVIKSVAGAMIVFEDELPVNAIYLIAPDGTQIEVGNYVNDWALLAVQSNPPLSAGMQVEFRGAVDTSGENPQ